MMRGEKGITLIALVITIIVMLILVGVTITFAVNGGLFSKANDASKETRTAQINEAIALTKADLYADYYDPTNTTAAAKPDVLTTYLASSAATNTVIQNRINNTYLNGTGCSVTVGAFNASDGTYSITLATPDTENAVGTITATIYCSFWQTAGGGN